VSVLDASGVRLVDDVRRLLFYPFRDYPQSVSRHWSFPFVVVFAGAVLLSACGESGDPEPTPTESIIAPDPGPSVSTSVVSLLVTGAETTHLVGRWVPVDFTGATAPDLEFRTDGTWRASDGCNETEGTWTDVGAGVVEVTAGPTTLIGCEGVPTAGMLQQAVRIDFAPEVHMLLVDASEATVLELVKLDEGT
jgi:heat shock protein HslJ